MSTRMKVVILGALGVLAATSLIGALMVRHLQDSFEEEVGNRARVLLAAISGPCVCAMSSSRIEDLDYLISEFRDRMAGSADVAEVAVLDGRRRVVGHTDATMYGRILDDPFAVEAAAAAASLVRVEGEGRAREMLASIPLATALEGLPGIRWGTLTTRLRMEKVDAVLGRILVDSLELIGLLAALSGLVLFFLTDRVVLRPVARLKQLAEALRRGNLGARSGLSGRGDLAVLGHTFDQMAAELEQHTTNLQQLVQVRTEELNQTNRQLAATARQLSQTNTRLEELVRTDALTELWNRRHLTENLAFHFALARRGKRKLAFAMLDVDWFKTYNDTHGHPAGDEILRGLAQILRERVRQTDLACRYGGEEFAILFPDTDAANAFAVCEELRQRVQATPFPRRETQPGGQVTVSIGVAEITDDMQVPSELVQRADEALYAAKQEGRNRIRQSDHGGSSG